MQQNMSHLISPTSRIGINRNFQNGGKYRETVYKFSTKSSNNGTVVNKFQNINKSKISRIDAKDYFSHSTTDQLGNATPPFSTTN